MLHIVLHAGSARPISCRTAAVPALEQRKAHGGDGGFDLMRPEGVVVDHLPASSVRHARACRRALVAQGLHRQRLIVVPPGGRAGAGRGWAAFSGGCASSSAISVSLAARSGKYPAHARPQPQPHRASSTQDSLPPPSGRSYSRQRPRQTARHSPHHAQHQRRLPPQIARESFHALTSTKYPSPFWCVIKPVQPALPPAFCAGG